MQVFNKLQAHMFTPNKIPTVPTFFFYVEHYINLKCMDCKKEQLFCLLLNFFSCLVSLLLWYLYTLLHIIFTSLI